VEGIWILVASRNFSFSPSPCNRGEGWGEGFLVFSAKKKNTHEKTKTRIPEKERPRICPADPCRLQGVFRDDRRRTRRPSRSRSPGTEQGREGHFHRGIETAAWTHQVKTNRFRILTIAVHSISPPTIRAVFDHLRRTDPNSTSTLGEPHHSPDDASNESCVMGVALQTLAP
jgi:hypothetical protein